MAFPNDPIKHVIVLMLENRSFDHLLGDLAQLDPARGIAGIDPHNLRSNPYPGGTPIAQQDNAQPTQPKNFDPRHEHPDVVKQLGSLGNPTMDGFVADAVEQLGKQGFGRNDIAQVMAYFKATDDLNADPLPALRSLARHFTVCDHWFASLPGPTWPNRFFATCGTAAGHIRMPEGAADIGLLLKKYDMPTIFDRVIASGRTCRIFHDGVSLSMMLRSTWGHADLYGSMDDFEAACAGAADDFPAFSFIEPKYFSVFSDTQNDQHPPHDMRRGDQLIAKVYNQLRANQAVWDSALLVVLYDEHGGFYDHVVPPVTVAPDGALGDSLNFDFKRLGVRVPALLVSPHVKAGGLNSAVYDHTSLLAYLCRKWDMPPLGARCAQAQSFENAIIANANTAAPASIPEVTIRATRALAPDTVPANGNQRALTMMVDYLHAELGLSSGTPTRGLQEGGTISGDQVVRKSQQVLARMNALAQAKAAQPTSSAPEAVSPALPGTALKVLMVHGVGHGDAPQDAAWKERWTEAFRQSALAARYAPVGSVQFEFADFDAIFNRYPLDPASIARGLFILAKDAQGSATELSTQALAASGLPQSLRWTAGMAIQWIENADLRQALRESLLAQFTQSRCDIVCAHSLGAIVCYDAFRRTMAKDGGALFSGKCLLTFGTQLAHPAIQSIFGGRIEPLYDAAGQGFEQWFHLYNPLDAVFTRPLPGDDARTHSLVAQFDIPNDLLNHDGDWYLNSGVTASVVMPAVLPRPPAESRQLPAALMAPALLTASPQKRRALLIGINDYPDPNMQLNGCINDVFLVSSVLQERGFDADDIRILTDRRATRSAMLERLDWLADGVRDGDERVLFYSGHGAQMPLYGGNGEPATMCETLVPVDFDWTLEHAFTDREFQSYYSHLPYGAGFLGIFDCCHAGGMTRGVQRVRGIDPPDDVRHRALRWSPQHQMWVPRDFAETASKAPRSFELQTAKKTHVATVPRQRTTLGDAGALRLQDTGQFDAATGDYGHMGPYLPMLMFAASQDELAAEYVHGSVSYGAFTFALARHLRQQRRAPSFNRLLAGVRNELAILGYQQTPTVIGPKARVNGAVPIFRWKAH